MSQKASTQHFNRGMSKAATITQLSIMTQVHRCKGRCKLFTNQSTTSMKAGLASWRKWRIKKSRQTMSLCALECRAREPMYRLTMAVSKDIKSREKTKTGPYSPHKGSSRRWQLKVSWPGPLISSSTIPWIKGQPMDQSEAAELVLEC